MVLHESAEDYLEALYILEKNMPEVRSVNLAEFLGYTKPSITNMVKILVDAKMVNKNPQGVLRLTRKGRNLAEATYEKHCFFYEMLLSAGIDENLAQKEACKMEHDVSDESFRKLKKMLLLQRKNGT